MIVGLADQTNIVPTFRFMLPTTIASAEGLHVALVRHSSLKWEAMPQKSKPCRDWQESDMYDSSATLRSDAAMILPHYL